MVRTRMMDDDGPYAREVATRLKEIVDLYPEVLRMGDIPVYGKRSGPGVRISFDVSIPSGGSSAEVPDRRPQQPGRVWVDAEQVDTPRAPARRPTIRRRALPRGSE